MSRDDWKDEERQKIDLVEVWNEVDRHRAEEKKYSDANRNSRWKTIRVFVSSTFKDFHSERDALVKEVFPELRDWCQKRDLNLVECDLRWGVPKETPYCVTLQICLDEIRRCEQENKWPFFLNMISKRAGWIPVKDELPAELILEFNLVIGLSVTEMEIVEAAYRNGNPNSLFLWREESFLDEITDETVRKEFLDELYPIADKKLNVLKQHVQKRFPDQIVSYSCNYIPGKNLPFTNRVQLQLSPLFKDVVLRFFKKRIEDQYPYEDNLKQNKYETELNQEDAFMQHRATSIIGRDDIVTTIHKYIKEPSSKPLILLGDAGCGKSTIMAKVIFDILKSDSKSYKEERESSVVFFHFVGAVPSSTSLFGLLRRFLYEMKQFDIPNKSKELLQCVKSLLSVDRGDESKKILIFIDALNQLDSEDFTSQNPIHSWLPKTLRPTVKCIISMIPHSTPHEILVNDRTNHFVEVQVHDLHDLIVKHDIISKYLMNFRKKLGETQALLVLNHEGSKNILWLITACDELRYFGEFNHLTNYITKLPSTLDQLLGFVLDRIYKDIEDKDILIATLCLMECSKNGLLEVELLEMLATFDTKTDYTESCFHEGNKLRPRLLYWKWGCIYRHLKNFIRPYGDSGEGRLDFYHRSMSKVVREKYLCVSDGEQTQKKKYYRMMATYFETSLNLDRRIEEYPHHLIELGDFDRLQKFLLEWEVFLGLYDSECSQKLLDFWRNVDKEYLALGCGYKELIAKFKENEKISPDELVDRMEKVARIFSQAGLFKDAMDLAKESKEYILKLEETEERKKTVMYLTGLLAHLEVTLNLNYDAAINLHSEAKERCRTLADQNEYSIKRFKALQHMKHAFCLGQKACQMSSLFKKTAKLKLKLDAKDLCCQAIEIYRDIKDYSNLLEAKFTEASLAQDRDKAHQMHEDLIRECRSLHGAEHDLIVRALFNDGTDYETDKRLDEAYDRFRAAYLLHKHLYGPKHSTTLYYLGVLREQKYSKISGKRKENLEEATWSVSCLP